MTPTAYACLLWLALLVGALTVLVALEVPLSLPLAWLVGAGAAVAVALLWQAIDALVLWRRS